MSLRALTAAIVIPDDDVDVEEPVWISLDEIQPDEDYDGSLDGDDSILADTHAMGGYALRYSGVSKPTAPKRKRKAKIVLFIEDIKRGEKGYHVLALKRALSRAHDVNGKPFLKWAKFDPFYNKRTIKAVKRFQAAKVIKTKAGKRLNVNVLRADGVYGIKTHAKLARFYDPYSAYLLARAKKQEAHEDAAAAARHKIQVGQAAMALTYNNRYTIHYTQGTMRMSGVRSRLRPPRYGTWEDCSSEATWVLWVAGYPDPNGLGYAGYGYTGTMQPHGAIVKSIRDAKPLDLILYGGPSHVATCFHRRKDGVMLVHSHGSEAGPLVLRHDYRHDRHSIHRYA